MVRAFAARHKRVMIQRPRFAAALALAVVLASPVTSAALPLPWRNKTKPPATAPVIPVGVWAHTASDLAPDPQARFGTLTNGMRYALMKNATPSGQASLRMRIDAGSLMESDVEQGLAHFLEHMAFNGSKNVPEGEMTKILERHGLAFGADTNASTGWTETVYKLDLPQADDDTVDTSLMLLRETAGNLLIAPESVDRERGVILSEERARDTPGYRVFKLREAFILKDQLASRRMPIGQVQVIRSVPAAALESFYRRYYRPERTTLVATGDFDLDAMEAKIKARFSDWSPSGSPGVEPVLGSIAKRGEDVMVAVEAGAPLTIQFSWLNPARRGPETEAKVREDLNAQLGLAVFNRRLERLARADAPPFIGAGADKDDEFRSAELTSLQVRADPATWRTALTAAEHEQRRLVQYGVRQDELDREIQEMRTQLQARRDAAATRRTPYLANMIIDSVDSDEVVRSPGQDLELFEALIKSVTAQTVSKAMDEAFAGQGPLIFVATPAEIEGDAQAVRTTFDAAAASPVDPPSVEAVKSWPYERFGETGKVVERKEVTDLDAVFVRFANGVRLTVKPTKFRDQQVMVSVRVGQGRETLAWSGANVAWMAGQAFTDGGLKQLTMEDLERIMAPRVVGANLSIDDDAFELSGVTRPQDFPTELQLLAAYLTEPGWRPEAFARWRTLGGALNEQYEATPGGVLRRDLAQMLRSGDQRWAFPGAKEIAASKPEDLRSLLRALDPASPIEVVVVGDIPVDKAIDGVAQTFGALPRAQGPAAAAEKPIAFPAPTAQPIVLNHKGRADQAIGYVAWPTDDFFADMAKARAVRVLGYVMQLRLTDQLREVEGATYSPSASAIASEVFDGYGFLAATVEMPPGKLDGFFSEVDRIAEDLGQTEVSADELARAKTSRIQALEKARETNEYWIGALSGSQADSRRLDAVRSAVAGLQRVGAADLRKAAQAYLKGDSAWRLKIVPNSSK